MKSLPYPARVLLAGAVALGLTAAVPAFAPAGSGLASAAAPKKKGGAKGKGKAKGKPKGAKPKPKDDAKDPLEAAREAARNLKYAKVVTHATRALELPDNSHDVMVELYELLGIAHAATGDEEAAVDAFKRLLAVSPEHKLRSGLSPRITTPFKEAGGYWIDRPGGLKVEVSVPPEVLPNADVTLNVAITDPLGMATNTRLRYRRASSTEWIDLELPAAGSLAYSIPGVGSARGGRHLRRGLLRGGLECRRWRAAYLRHKRGPGALRRPRQEGAEDSGDHGSRSRPGEHGPAGPRHHQTEEEVQGRQGLVAVDHRRRRGGRGCGHRGLLSGTGPRRRPHPQRRSSPHR